MCCCRKFKLSGAFCPVLTFLYCVDELGLGQVGHVKCFTALDHSTGFGALLCPVFNCSSKIMSHIPSCESPWSPLPVRVRAVSLGQFHLCSPCAPEVYMAWWGAEGDLCRRGLQAPLLSLSRPLFLAMLEFAGSWENCFQL